MSPVVAISTDIIAVHRNISLPLTDLADSSMEQISGPFQTGGLPAQFPPIQQFRLDLQICCQYLYVCELH